MVWQVDAENCMLDRRETHNNPVYPPMRGFSSVTIDQAVVPSIRRGYLRYLLSYVLILINSSSSSFSPQIYQSRVSVTVTFQVLQDSSVNVFNNLIQITEVVELSFHSESHPRRNCLLV